MSNIRLIAGLGNPGSDYQLTRHNVGFWMVDAIAEQLHVNWFNEGKFFGSVARVRIDSRYLWLIKPMTYMNLSGKAIVALANFYKVNCSEILIIHDELDLPAGVIRFKQGGGHGGHNGLKDSVARLGGGDFLRLRIGIGRPSDRSEVVNYVLQKPSNVELLLINDSIGRALNVVPQAINGQVAKAMQVLHSVVVD